MANKEITDEELENKLELEMLSDKIHKRCNNFNTSFEGDDAKENYEDAIDDIKISRLLIKKYETCLKKVKIK